MLKELPSEVTSFPHVAARRYPSGSMQSTTGEEIERERCERWTSLATIPFSSSWSRKSTLLSSQPCELWRLCHTLTDRPGPSQETSSSSGSLKRGSTSEYPRISRIK